MCSRGGHFHGRGEKNKIHKVVRIIFMTIVGVILACLFALLFGYITKMLWNWVMPEVFGLNSITYWQAVALLILAKIIFGLGRGAHGSKRHSEHIHRKVEKKWHKMLGVKDHLDEYEQFWEKEGKEAFQNYLDKMYE